MIRWALILSEFNIEWEHRPGTQNVVANVLCRNSVDNVEGLQISCAALRALAMNSREQLIQEQREDPDDNGPQFISDVFEHLSHRLDIKTVKYWPQANLTERVNRTLVQVIACFVEENHDNWDRFLHELSFALRAAVNEFTGKTPAELFLGRKIIMPFRKLVRVTDGADYVGGNIEKLFDEERQKMQRQQKTVLEVQNNNLTICKRERRVTVNITQVRIYHPRHSNTNSFDSINETLYEGKGSSNSSNRVNSGKSRRSREPSGNESKSCKSNNGTAGLEELRFKRTSPVVSTGTAERSSKDYQRSTGSDSLPQNGLRRRSLSMEALDGDPVDRSTSKKEKKSQKLPPPILAHVPAEKRSFEEMSMPFSKRPSKVRITPVIRLVSRHPQSRPQPELPIAEPLVPEPIQIPEPPVPELVEIHFPDLETLEPTLTDAA
ncbi:retrovirus-related Pol polyprotein from transposon 297 [Trichonephila clavipes]|nr:retrovirus-related Pol polyprotein from transposon 297 [Trichonephila clavipes]